MGVYDIIIAKCPNCGVKNYFQTKSGKCCLYEYEIETAPFEAMLNANRHTPQECGKWGRMLIVDVEHRKLLLADDNWI